MDSVQHQARINFMKKYDNSVLIKLRRTYSENEAVMWALNKLKEMLVERGKNNSYIHELEDKVIKLEKELSGRKKQVPLTSEERGEYDRYISMKSEMETRRKLNEKIRKLEIINKDLVGRMVRKET